MSGVDKRIFRFGVFEADANTGELRKAGMRLRVQEKPFQVLLVLLERPGEVVTREELRQIVDVQLVRLRQRLEERKIELDLTDKARDYLAQNGYDPSYGARPLKRLIQRELETALGRKLLSGEVRDNSRVKVDAGARGLEFSSEPLASAA